MGPWGLQEIYTDSVFLSLFHSYPCSILIPVPFLSLIPVSFLSLFHFYPYIPVPYYSVTAVLYTYIFHSPHTFIIPISILFPLFIHSYLFPIMLRRIVNCPPPHIYEVSKSCQRILKALMHKNPEKRLGAQGAEDIKKHPWFYVSRYYVKYYLRGPLYIALLSKRAIIYIRRPLLSERATIYIYSTTI